MITLKQAARQVVEDWEKGRFISTSIIELREVLGELDVEDMTLTQIAARDEQTKQKPAAWTTIKNGIPETWMWNPEFVEKNKDAEVVLYAAPVRTKDLTDDEICEVTGCNKDAPLWLAVSGIARAVIAAYREKNK